MDVDEALIMTLVDRLKLFTEDIHKLKRARESIGQLQTRKTMWKLLGDGGSHEPLSFRVSKSFISGVVDSSHQVDSDYDEGEEEGDFDECFELPEDKWFGYFRGFQILKDPINVDLNENKKCVELTKQLCDEDLSHYLRTGIRCFMLDLFTGTQYENQCLLIQLRQSEIHLSKEIGFPVVSTVFARLSSRYQYTGYLNPPESSINLTKGDRIYLSTERKYSNRCTSTRIYVNARFLLADVKKYDFILVGCDIQLIVLEVYKDYLYCCVARSGKLKSYLPVLFPPKCKKFRVSFEELEDISFAREGNINVIVSDIAGTIEYLKDLQNAIALLECENMKLYARVVLNKIQGCDGDMNWVTEMYDGFLVELAAPAENEDVPAIMHLCPDGECFMKLAYESKKPIVLDPSPIGQQVLRIEPEHYFYTFYYPDKYLIKCNLSKNAFYFSFLQNSIFETIPPMVLPQLPFCDESHTGADAIARAAVAASFEMAAIAIIVCGTTTRMVQKLAHYRPKVPIIFVSHMRSAEDYVSLYHNVTMLPFISQVELSNEVEMYKKALFGFAYLSQRKIIKEGKNAILIYGSEPGTKFPDKYLAYKFSKKNFVSHLAQSMFPNTNTVHDYMLPDLKSQHIEK